MTSWEFQRHLARIEPVVEKLLAEHASGYWGRPLRRRDDPPTGATWTIEGEVVVEFRYRPGQADQLLVHDVSLVVPLRQHLRTRHVEIQHA